MTPHTQEGLQGQSKKLLFRRICYKLNFSTVPLTKMNMVSLTIGVCFGTLLKGKSQIYFRWLLQNLSKKQSMLKNSFNYLRKEFSPILDFTNVKTRAHEIRQKKTSNYHFVVHLKHNILNQLYFNLTPTRAPQKSLRPMQTLLVLNI